MEKEYKIESAIAAAENEGMTGKVLPNKIKFLEVKKSQIFKEEVKTNNSFI